MLKKFIILWTDSHKYMIILKLLNVYNTTKKKHKKEKIQYKQKDSVLLIKHAGVEWIISRF